MKPEDIIAEQKRSVARATALATSPQAPASVPAVQSARDPVQMYLDSVAPSSFVGELVKFDKTGKFIVGKDGKSISDDEDFVALCDQTLIGWIKFSDDPDTAPERFQGLLYDGFTMPSRASLGDLNEADWPEGLNGLPADPWMHQQMIVLQSQRTKEFYTFATTSQTGRRAVGNLLRHYDRMRRNDPGCYPIVRLKPSGFQHKDSRVGFVHTPSFQIVGKVSADSGHMPATTAAADMNDDIPW